MKISNKRELQQIALNHSSDIDFKNFIKIYKNCRTIFFTAEPQKFTPESDSFSVNNTTLPSNDPLRFRKNLFE